MNYGWVLRKMLNSHSFLIKSRVRMKVRGLAYWVFIEVGMRRISFWTLNHQTLSLLSSRNNASNRVKLVKTKKFKSSADNQPFLISAGLLALGNKNKSDAKKPKRCWVSYQNIAKRPKSVCIFQDSSKADDPKQFEIKYDDLDKISSSENNIDSLNENYMCHEKSFEVTSEQVYINQVKYFRSNESVLLNDKKHHLVKREGS